MYLAYSTKHKSLGVREAATKVQKGLDAYSSQEDEALLEINNELLTCI